LDRFVWVIIAAAGRGLRARGEVPKQFRRLGDSTVIETVVSRFAGMPEVGGIVVALPPSGIPEETGIASRHIEAAGRGRVPVVCVSGGETRQESVKNALRFLPEDACWVAVHDAARPFFSDELFRRVLDAALSSGAAVPGVTPSDTIKRVSGESGAEDAEIEATLDRKMLVAVQTPQIFRRDILVSAYRRAEEDGFSGTDDSQLVERLGVRVRVVEGEPENVKLTYPSDFEKAEIFLGRRGITEGRPQDAWVTVTGFGFDAHPMDEGRPCVLGGVTIPHSKGPAGHSDADVLTHAVMDALLGAMSAGDIGKWFPETPEYKDARSVELMKAMWEELSSGGKAEIIHVDTVILAQAPRIAPYTGAMKETLARSLGIGPQKISIKATTTEGMGFVGREEGIAAFCTATVRRSLRSASNERS